MDILRKLASLIGMSMELLIVMFAIVMAGLVGAISGVTGYVVGIHDVEAEFMDHVVPELGKIVETFGETRSDVMVLRRDVEVQATHNQLYMDGCQISAKRFWENRWNLYTTPAQKSFCHQLVVDAIDNSMCRHRAVDCMSLLCRQGIEVTDLRLSVGRHEFMDCETVEMRHPHPDGLYIGHFPEGTPPPWKKVAKTPDEEAG